MYPLENESTLRSALALHDFTWEKRRECISRLECSRQHADKALEDLLIRHCANPTENTALEVNRLAGESIEIMRSQMLIDSLPATPSKSSSSNS